MAIRAAWFQGGTKTLDVPWLLSRSGKLPIQWLDAKRTTARMVRDVSDLHALYDAANFTVGTSAGEGHLGVGLCAKPCQIGSRYCCIIGVAVAGAAAGCVLM